jgi:hypothetical protein
MRFGGERNRRYRLTSWLQTIIPGPRGPRLHPQRLHHDEHYSKHRNREEIQQFASFDVLRHGGFDLFIWGVLRMHLACGAIFADEEFHLHSGFDSR